jgi:hypothetical protein
LQTNLLKSKIFNIKAFKIHIDLLEKEHKILKFLSSTKMFFITNTIISKNELTVGDTVFRIPS